MLRLSILLFRVKQKILRLFILFVFPFLCPQTKICLKDESASSKRFREPGEQFATTSNNSIFGDNNLPSGWHWEPTIQILAPVELSRI